MGGEEGEEEEEEEGVVCGAALMVSTIRSGYVGSMAGMGS